VKEIRLDCDGDVVLLQVEQQGGVACHTGGPVVFSAVWSKATGWKLILCLNHRVKYTKNTRKFKIMSSDKNNQDILQRLTQTLEACNVANIVALTDNGHHCIQLRDDYEGPVIGRRMFTRLQCLRQSLQDILIVLSELII